MTSRPSIVVPDIHGQPEFLEWVLDAFPGRHLILLGDLIHRGPDSRRALQLAIVLAQQGRAQLLWGNHEHWVWTAVSRLPPQAWLDWFRFEDWDETLLHAYGGTPQGLAECVHDLGVFASLAKPYVVEGEMLCAHAARPSLGRTPDDLLDDGYLWDRPGAGLHPLPTHFYPELQYSVHGHTVLKKPIVDLEGEGVVYVDLGSSKTGRFCVWDAESKQVIRCEGQGR